MIKKDQKIKTMEMQKKNDELCAQLESTNPGSLANELGALDLDMNVVDDPDGDAEDD